jgi:hypothetical protein
MGEKSRTNPDFGHAETLWQSQDEDAPLPFVAQRRPMLPAGSGAAIISSKISQTFGLFQGSLQQNRQHWLPNYP